MSLVSVELEAQPAGTIASPPGYVELPFEFDLGGEALRDSYEGSLFGVRSVDIVMHAHGCTLTLLPPPRRHGVMVTVARPWWTFDVLHYEPFGVQGIMDMGRMPRYARRGSDDGTASDAEDEDGFDPAPALTQMPEWMEMQALQKTASLQDCANAFMARGGDLRVVHPTDGTVRCVRCAAAGSRVQEGLASANTWLDCVCIAGSASTPRTGCTLCAPMASACRQRCESCWSMC